MYNETGSLVNQAVVLLRFEDETYLMQLKNGHRFRLLDIRNVGAWDKEYEHRNFSLVLSERQL